MVRGDRSRAPGADGIGRSLQPPAHGRLPEEDRAEALADDDLDAILSPSYAFGTSGPAVAGYPLISVPVGISSEGRPAGVWLSGGSLSEPKLIALAYAIEPLLDARKLPRFRGSVPPEPADAGICAALPGANRGSAGTGHVPIDRTLMRRLTRQRPAF
jgi:hypothetical protein